MLQIETARLLIRGAEPSLAAMIVEYEKRNRNFFKPWIPERLSGYYTVSGQEMELNRRAKNWSAGSEYRFYFSKKSYTESIIGDFGFSGIIYGAFQSCYLGYKQDEKAVGQGYMQEALQRGIQYIFQTVRLHRIEANVMPHNERSIQLLKKLGFNQEGYSKQFIRINKNWEDHLRFAILNEQME